MRGSGTSGATLSEVIAFAEDENIRVVLVTGSTARGETHPLSDLDVELYGRDPQPLLPDDSWHWRFGRVVAVEALPNPGWHPTRLLYLTGAKKIDFVIAPVTALHDARYDRPSQWWSTRTGWQPTCRRQGARLVRLRPLTSSWSASTGSRRRRSCARNRS